jgi:hypothetical protein
MAPAPLPLGRCPIERDAHTLAGVSWSSADSLVAYVEIGLTALETGAILIPVRY